MANAQKKIKIAAVADVHLRESERGKWIECFRAVSEQADVLLICGDLTDTGQESEAQVLAEELHACTIPVVCVLGNHDYERGQQEAIKKALVRENIHLLDGEAVIIDHVGFAGIKGFGGGFDRYMMPMFGEDINKQFVQEVVNEALRLDQALVRLEDGSEQEIKKIAVLHYAPVKDTVVGEPPEIFPFLGSSHLAEPLNRRQVVAAFHGHAHLGTLEGKTSEGIKVFNVAKAILHREGYKLPFFMFEV